MLNATIFEPAQMTFELFNILIEGRHYALHFLLNVDFRSTVKMVRFIISNMLTK